MLIVVNVDDFGLHPAVGRAVRDLSRTGIVTSTTVLANGPHARDAASLDGVGVGVHLNILRGRPLSPLRDVATLVGDDGLFLGRYPMLLVRYATGGVGLAQVEREWSRQIEAVLDLGVKPTHLDSEKHIHAWPGLMGVASRLAAKYGIGWVRRPVERTVFRLDAGSLRTAFLGLCSLGHRGAKGVGWPDGVWGIAEQGRNLTPARFEDHAGRIGRAKVLEIVCHPGAPRTGDPDLPVEFGPMRVESQWEDEFKGLSSPGWKDAFNRAGASLVNYGQINPLSKTLFS